MRIWQRIKGREAVCSKKPDLAKKTTTGTDRFGCKVAEETSAQLSVQCTLSEHTECLNVTA